MTMREKEIDIQREFCNHFGGSIKNVNMGPNIEETVGSNVINTQDQWKISQHKACDLTYVLINGNQNLIMI